MLTLLVSLLACTGGDVAIIKARIDNDGDGYTEEVDCDDAHATVNPDAAEVCDGLDNDCDGAVDDEATDGVEVYVDADGDGWGDASASAVLCEIQDGFVETAGDCDDGLFEVNPDAAEICDELDNDCDGSADEEATDAGTWYADSDEDGYGDESLSIVSCDAPDGYVAVSESAFDCEDADPAIHPDAPESDCTDPTDYNCDGAVGYADADADGVPACEDCDDADAARSPELVEVCDEADTDEDCSGAADDEDGATTGTSTWTRDIDGDGYGGGGPTMSACDAPTGYAADTGDCDDYDGAVNPGAAEVCDEANTDEDCSGAADDDDAGTDPSTWITWSRDADSDGYGDSSRTITVCDAVPGYVNDGSDCDDGDSGVNPGAAEICDASDTDEDCDGLADDDDGSATGASPRYDDDDGDGYGDASSSIDACDAVAGHVDDDTDCDDADATVHPDAVETCNALDDDCDGLTDDEDAPVTGTSTWYADLDLDGFGDPDAASDACAQPSGTVAADVADTDCDDDDGAINPDAAETCNSIDDDCDGLVDDADPTVSGTATWHVDGDGDGFGDPDATTQACEASAGVVADATDCDDADGAINPDAAEICDALDDDCDGLIDDEDDSLSGAPSWYTDGDGDGYGSASVSSSCEEPADAVTDGDDCDDESALSNPGHAEICHDEADNDCDGSTDEGCVTPDVYGDYSLSSSGSGANSLVYGVTGSYGSHLGELLANGGDLNGDGREDIVAGSTLMKYGSDYGGAWVLHGRLSSGAAQADAIDDAWIYGSSTSGVISSGYVATILPDVDNDGYDELNMRYLPSSGDSRAALYEGEDITGTFAASSNIATYVPGCHASGAGDLDDDGDNDWVAGTCTAATTDPGTLYVCSGTACSSSSYDAAVEGEAANDFGGYTSAGSPGSDVNGDGIDDLFVSAYRNDAGGADAGAAYVLLGPVSGTFDLGSADHKIVGTTADYFGMWVSAPGDLDGDGYADLVVAAPYNSDAGSNAGAVALFTNVNPDGSSPDERSADASSTFTGEIDDYLAAYGVDLGDVDEDGYADLLVAAPWHDASTSSTYTGVAYLTYGPFTGDYDLSSDAHATFSGASAVDLCGRGAKLIDHNGDGADDVVVACTQHNYGTGYDVGVLFVFNGG